MPKANGDHSSDRNNLPSPLTKDPVLQDFLTSEPVQEGFVGLTRYGPSYRGRSNPPMRLIPVDSDAMVPTLREGDAVAVVPVNRFSSDGLYVIDFRGRARVFRCAYDFRGEVLLMSDNTVYPHEKVTWDEFGSLVLGRVALVCKWVWQPH